MNIAIIPNKPKSSGLSNLARKIIEKKLAPRVKSKPINDQNTLSVAFFFRDTMVYKRVLIYL